MFIFIDRLKCTYLTAKKSENYIIFPAGAFIKNIAISIVVQSRSIVIYFVVSTVFLKTNAYLSDIFYLDI